MYTVHVYIIFSVHVEAGPFWSIWMKLGLLEWITRMECPGWNLVLMICMNSRSHDDRYQNMHTRIYRNAVYMVLFAVRWVLFQSTSFFACVREQQYLKHSKLRHIASCVCFPFVIPLFLFLVPFLSHPTSGRFRTHQPSSSHMTQHGAKGEDDWNLFVSFFPRSMASLSERFQLIVTSHKG